MERQAGNNSEALCRNLDPDRGEKIQRIAYHLWRRRRENSISGSAEQDYYQAETIYDSHKARKHESLGTLCAWTVTYLAGPTPEPLYLNAAQAAVAFNSLVQEYDML
jgi:hypothetical protein